MLTHYAIDIDKNCNYNWVIENLLNKSLLLHFINPLSKEGALFSHTTIDKIITEELLHDKIEITSATNKNLKSMSSGEQKKALLHNIIIKNPGFIIVENAIDNLDTAAQKNIIEQLQQISETILIIQIVARISDILPFIKTVITIKNNTIFAIENTKHYLQQKSTIQPNYTITIPKALNQYNLPNNTLVKMQNVCVSYDEKKVLNNINWTINVGEFWQLFGPNGSGKSTLLTLITGDNPKAYGQNIFLFAKKKGSGETVWDIKKNIGYLNATMAQFFPRLDSVEKMVLSGFFDSVGLYVVPNETQIKIAHQWLYVIELFEDKNKPFCFLPLGKQRMVLVARAMIKHPPLLILDEPTNGLDDTEALLFVLLINKIAKESTTAILYVSHRKEEGLQPKFIYELVARKDGSVGKVNKV